MRSNEPGFVESVKSQVRNVIDNYRALIKHLQVESPEILKGALEPTFELSQELVPVKTGNLKASGYLETSIQGDQAFCEIGYARGGFPHYAIDVHENPEQFHEPPTQYKFLQQPLEDDFPNIASRVIAGYKEASGV